MRDQQESQQLRWGDFERKVDNFGNKYFEFQERTTKTCQGRTGDARAFKPKLWPNVAKPERCPLYLLDEYEKHRPLGMNESDSPFYLMVNHNSTCLVPLPSHGEKMLYVGKNKGGGHAYVVKAVQDGTNTAPKILIQYS